MVILIAGATHTGKTALSQKLLEKYHYPYLSIDHLKMGLIRSGNTNLTPMDDEELTGYLWPIVREMIKTAIENKQNLIVEGCYIPFDWRKDFEEDYLENIRYLDSLGKYMEIRIPYIPGYNDSQMEAIAKFLAGLKNRYRIKLLPYHDYGNAKAERLGVKMTEIPHPEPERITAALACFLQFGLDAVNGAAH